ncbi:MAG: ECF-type sigma factor [Gemmatimonadaceae bacterium]
MNTQESTSVTELLGEWRSGRGDAFDRIFPIVYHELHRIAHRALNARPSDTLSTTALVHESYLKLVDAARSCFLGNDDGLFAFEMYGFALVPEGGRRVETAQLDYAPNVGLPAGRVQ